MYISDDNKAVESWISSLGKDTMLSPEVFGEIVKKEVGVERETLIARLEVRAGELGIKRQFQRMFKAYHADAVQKLKQAHSGIMYFTKIPLKGLCCGEWECGDTGIYRTVTDGWEVKKVYACQHPILPTKRLHNMDDGTEKIELAFYKDKRWQYIVTERSRIATTNKIVELADRSIEVTSENAKELIRYLSDVVSLNTEKIPVYESIARLGWTDKGFAPYMGGVEYDGDLDFKQLYEDISQRGDYDEWKRYCTKLRENIYLRMMMAASFASPLIERLGVLPFVLHMWGGTGTGKTVGLMCAMSIWGDPEIGHLVRTLNMTQNAMARTAAFLYSVPFAGDELQIIKSRWDSMDNLIMYITEGVDRGRAKAYGGVEQLRTWRNSFIFTGEEPVTKTTSGGGVKNRVIEIQLKDCVVRDGNETSNFMRENYGFAGKEFIERIKDKDLKKRYREIFEEILSQTDTTDKQAMAMAVLLLADELSVEYIFTDETPLGVGDVQGFLSSKNEIDIAARAYDWTRNWIAQNENRFSDVSNNGELWGKIDGDVAVINKNAYTEHLEKAGFSYSAVAGKLAERGQLLRNTQGKYFHCTKVYGVKGLYVKIDLNAEENNEYRDIEVDEDELPF